LDVLLMLVDHLALEDVVGVVNEEVEVVKVEEEQHHIRSGSTSRSSCRSCSSSPKTRNDHTWSNS
jgi:hypothetical protein